MNTHHRLLAGAVIWLASSGAPVLAQTPSPATHPVVHIEILGADAPRLQRFYADLFGWKITLDSGTYGYVSLAPAPPVVLTGGIGPSPQGRPLAVFYVKVDDPVAVLKRVEALGGRIVVPPVEVSRDLTYARFSDPEGNIIGIVRRQN
jgi:uncharacterized protein